MLQQLFKKNYHFKQELLMKIYLNSAKENWIVDRIKKEWSSFNKKSTTRFIFNSDIVWITAPWAWKKLNTRHLKTKTVVCSIYHLDEEKFDNNKGRMKIF